MGTETVVLAAGDPDAPPLVFFHGGGTFHGWAFAEPWTSSFRVLIPFHPGFGESGDLEGLRDVGDIVLHYVELFDQLGLDEGRQPRRLLVGRSHRRALRDRAEAPTAPARARRARRAARAGRRGAGLLHDPAGGARATARARHEHDPPVPPRRSPRRRLHRRPLPRDAHVGDHDVGAAVRPRARTLARPRRHPDAHRLGRGRRARCRRRSPTGWAAKLPNATVATFPDAGHLVLDESNDAREAVAVLRVELSEVSCRSLTSTCSLVTRGRCCNSSSPRCPTRSRRSSELRRSDSRCGSPRSTRSSGAVMSRCRSSRWSCSRAGRRSNTTP